MSAPDIAILKRIQGLLNLAQKNDNPHEAASAAAKAQELLTLHNLSADFVANETADGKREEQKVQGGTYAFERELWRNVAELNFCLYWSQRYTKTVERPVWSRSGILEGTRPISTQSRRHALVGRTVNVRSSIVLAQYLEQAIERVLQEYFDQDAHKESNLASNFAFSFRKGAAEDICERLQDKRREMFREERARKAAPTGDVGSFGRAITIASLQDSEHDANQDFLYGEGFSAKVAAERAKRADIERRMRQAYIVWAAAHPKEAASKFRFTDDDGREYFYGTDRRRYRSASPKETGDLGGIAAGREAARKIGLDLQMDASSAKRIGR